MNEVTELAERYVSMWNETDPRQRGKVIRELWAEDGMECTKFRLTRGHTELESRITASHEKNVRDAGCRFVLLGNADRNHDAVKLNWKMVCVEDGTVRATGSYMLLLNKDDRIIGAYFFSD